MKTPQNHQQTNPRRNKKRKLKATKTTARTRPPKVRLRRPRTSPQNSPRKRQKRNQKTKRTSQPSSQRRRRRLLPKKLRSRIAPRMSQLKSLR